LSLLGDQEKIINTIMQYVSQSLPGSTLALLQQVIHDIISTNSAPGLISIGILLALWSGSSMFTSLMGALNRAYEVDENRSWWRQRLIALGCAAGGVIVLWLATIIMVAGEQIVHMATHFLHLDMASALTWAVVQYVLAFVLIATFIWLLYLILPNAKQSKRISLVGAMVAAVLWTGFTYGFRVYVQHFGGYNKAYGSIGAVMVLLTWMYWSMFVILVGGELNAELEAGEGETNTH
jgi:membrane protein